MVLPGPRARAARHGAGNNVIEIRDLYKYFGDHRAIGPIAADIDAGQVVGVLGLNGAGKTTTLRILACDLLPTSGTVLVDGVDVVSDPNRVRSMVGYLPETPPLYGEMRVREYLGFVARLRGLDTKTTRLRVDAVLEMTELGGVANDPISTLSHGYRQRVGIAQAIVHQPRLVVLDEPISGLDPVQIVEMRRLIRNLRSKHTVLISSHILSEISETCDRILVVREGKIVASGTEGELSAQFLQGITIELTVRLAAGEPESLLDRVRRIPGASGVELVPPRETGVGVLSLRVVATADIRPLLVSTLVEMGVSVLELGRGQRELENVFLQLSDRGNPGDSVDSSSALLKEVAS